LGLLVAAKTISGVLSIVMTWGLLYGALFVWLIYKLLRSIYSDWKINFINLVIIRIGLMLLIYLFVYKLNFDPIWDFHRSLYGYVLIDDEEYYEDPYANDDDPVFGTDESEYYSTFKFFVPINTELEGLKLPFGTIQKDWGSSYYILDEYEEEHFINISKSIFWQYAFAEGYKPIDEGIYEVGGIGKQFLQIGPYFLIELIITNAGLSMLFALVVLIISLFAPYYIIDFIDQYALGLERLDLSDYDKAIEYFNKAIKRDSKNASIFYHRGFARYKNKDFLGSISDLDKAIRLDPTNDSYYYYRASAKHALKDYKGALEDNTKALKLDLDNNQIEKDKSETIK